MFIEEELIKAKELAIGTESYVFQKCASWKDNFGNLVIMMSQKSLPYSCVLCCGRVPASNAEGLLYKPCSLVVPTCTARCLHQRP